MIIAGTPIAIREIHHLSRWWLRTAFLGTDKRASGARFNFLYFSYAPDFPWLFLSLCTLKASLPRHLLGRIVLAEDQKAPFTVAQVERLRLVFPHLEVLPVYNFAWGSPQSTYAELQIFKQICARLPDPMDLLVKVDSDVLFLPSRRWEGLLRSCATAIGDGHYLQHQYAQGGLYMLRSQIVQDLLATVTLSEVESVALSVNSVGEDKAVTKLLSDRDHPFFFTRMMLFPEEYRLLPRLNALARSEFMALHCHKDKQNMPALVKQYGLLTERDCESFAIEVPQ